MALEVDLVDGEIRTEPACLWSGVDLSAVRTKQFMLCPLIWCALSRDLIHLDQFWRKLKHKTVLLSDKCDRMPMELPGFCPRQILYIRLPVAMNCVLSPWIGIHWTYCHNRGHMAVNIKMNCNFVWVKLRASSQPCVWQNRENCVYLNGPV